MADPGGFIYAFGKLGQAISEEEVLERRTEIRCPRCGRKLDSGEALVIKVGG